MGMTESVDVVVIGMGPGGEDLAGRLAESGLSVVGVESRLVGGECPYYGCIPSKMLIRAANAIAEARRVPVLAGRVDLAPDFTPVAQRIRAEATDNWDDRVAADRFIDKGGKLVRGRGRITGPSTVQVGDDEFTASRAIVINTGTDPAIPPIDGIAGTPYWTNREALEAAAAPESLIVLGGGPIGLELAQAFARFGTRVDIVEMAERIAPLEEPEASELLAGALTEDGLTLHTGCAAERVRYDDGFTVTTSDGELPAERLLVATGRRIDLEGLGVGSIGVDTKARSLETDDHMRVTDGVYAIGDVTGKGAFTHISMYQAAIATRAILGEGGPPAEYHAVPRVTFTDPEVGSLGLTEAQARDQGIQVRTAITEIPSSARGWIHKIGNAGIIKLVEDAQRGVLVGATSVGPTGGEVLSALSVAVHARVPTERLRHMIYAYPTFHRAIEDALGKLG